MLRRFRRDGGFHALIVVLLGLGIGAVTLVFSLVNELLLKPLPVRNARNLYLLERSSPDFLRPDSYFTERHRREVVLQNPLVAAAVAEQVAGPDGLVPFRQDGATRLVMVQIVSPNYFTELGIRPLAGRLLGEPDVRPAPVLPAVLSYHFWQSQFGGDRAVLGLTIRLKDTPFLVVGILPREFHSSDVDRSPEVRLPIPAGEALFPSKPEGVEMQILIRLAPGAAAAQAAASMLAPLRSQDEAIELQRNARDAHPVPAAQIHKEAESWVPALEPIKRGLSRMRAQFADALWVLLAGVGLLLFAVCANVAGLLIAKSGDRRKELGIRVAVGAGRWQILRQLLFENLILAAGGALLGAALAKSIAPQVIGLLPPVRDLAQFASPQLLVVTPDLRVLCVAIGATLFCVVASGLIPAWRASQVDLLSELKGKRDIGHSGVAATLPVSIQVAFGVVLVSAAGLMLRSYSKLDRLNPGFDRDHLIEFTFNPAAAGYDMKQSGAFFSAFRARVQALPGVRSASWAWRGVMRGAGIKTTMSPEGTTPPKGTFMNTSLNEVTPGYFETMGMPILAGRDLRMSDWKAQPAPVVVNQAFANLFFAGQNPIGKGLVAGAQDRVGQRATRVIVGLVPTAKYRSMREPDPPTVYGLLNEANGSDWQFVLYVRTHGGPGAIAEAVRKAATDVDPGVPLTEAVTLDSEIRTSLWQERLVAILSAFFGIASLSLAAIGVYGALAISVAGRRRELGIRVAVGATARHVAQTVCSTMARAVGAGLVAGAIASLWLLRLTRTLLFGVEPFDGVSFAAAAVVVLVCSGLAAALPARRAVKVDPAIALRQD
jgi:predicted permease